MPDDCLLICRTGPKGVISDVPDELWLVSEDKYKRPRSDADIVAAMN